MGWTQRNRHHIAALHFAGCLRLWVERRQRWIIKTRSITEFLCSTESYFQGRERQFDLWAHVPTCWRHCGSPNRHPIWYAVSRLQVCTITADLPSHGLQKLERLDDLWAFHSDPAFGPYMQGPWKSKRLIVPHHCDFKPFALWPHTIWVTVPFLTMRLGRTGDKMITINLIVLRQGCCAGLAADVRSEEGIRRIYTVKGRPDSKPLAICVADSLKVGQYAEVEQLPEGLLKELLPGPVTLVLKQKANIDAADNFNPGMQNIGKINCAQSYAPTVALIANSSSSSNECFLQQT